MHVPALQRSLPEIVAEYDAKKAAIAEAVRTFEKAGNTLKMAATIAGAYGDVTFDTGHVHESTMEKGLLKSAWKHVYDGLQIDRIASADDRNKWRQALESPAPFTLDNIRGTFGRFLTDPRGNILRGLAEVFCQLDQAYKSHDKVKIGVAGLPKRVVLRSVGYSDSYGRQKLRDILNALATYRGEPLTEYAEFNELDALHSSFRPRAGEVTIRGLRVRKFLNNNAHVFFDKLSLREINKALAEFYGDVLPDTTDEKPVNKQASTAVSKDLQFYGTPATVIKHVLDKIHEFKGKRVLEPSCGDGRFMDELRKRGALVSGIEVDGGRAGVARAKGHPVLLANFLETVPTPVYDLIVMNPPFYGKHYAKHVRHALKFLKPGGCLVAILPITARYDHGLLDDLIPKSRWGDTPWDDLPVGSFSESGTNINTTVLSINAPKS